MNNTLLRKSETTYVRQHHKELKYHVADKLLHKPETSDKYYNTVRKGERATETAMFLSNTFKGKAVQPSQKRDKDAIDIGNTVLKWQDEDTRKLERLFSEELRNEKITKDNVRAKLKTLQAFEVLKRLPPKIVEKKVLDKLRHILSINRTSGEKQVNFIIILNFSEILFRLVVVCFVHSFNERRSTIDDFIWQFHISVSDRKM